MMTFIRHFAMQFFPAVVILVVLLFVVIRRIQAKRSNSPSRGCLSWLFAILIYGFISLTTLGLALNMALSFPTEWSEFVLAGVALVIAAVVQAIHKRRFGSGINDNNLFWWWVIAISILIVLGIIKVFSS